MLAALVYVCACVSYYSQAASARPTRTGIATFTGTMTPAVFVLK